ncbi:hypothetical protein [Bathymodiolus platifrons methanotrophic gill symbiont]|uniref:hypothetical protein n=1 Tax=Bathymodiolus platifrons methanotrophic gill symbiont TaxID=113268 RepID=UPI001C8DC5C0|nr:hypothetical protein [Bathymodiolus platifrons methanotrophic gill symbiont]
MATSNGSTAIRDKILASLARYRALRIGKFPCAFWRLSSRPGLTAYEASTEFTMVVAKWHVRRTSGAPKALAVALSFCCLLGLGCPKQAFAKIATPRPFLSIICS